MSFVTDPSGSIYLTKVQGGADPIGKFYADDANLVRQGMLDIVNQFVSGCELPLTASSALFSTLSILNSITISGTLTASSGYYTNDVNVSSSMAGLILTSPNGTRFRITATDSGSLALTTI